MSCARQVAIFTDDKCVLKYQGVIILTRSKDPTTNLWTLPITPAAVKYKGMRSASQKLQAGPILACTPAHPQVVNDQSNHNTPQNIDWAAFAHSIRTQAKAVKFTHHSLGNPKLSLLMKALQIGLPQRVLKPQQSIGHKIPQPKPSHCKGPYETAKERNLQHNSTPQKE